MANHPKDTQRNDHSGGALTDDELEQVSGGAMKMLYDITVAGMRIRGSYDPETGDSRTTVVTAAGYGAGKSSSPD